MLQKLISRRKPSIQVFPDSLIGCGWVSQGIIWQEPHAHTHTQKMEYGGFPQIRNCQGIRQRV